MKSKRERGRYHNVFISHESDREDDNDVDRLAIQLTQKATVAVQREESFTIIYENLKEIVTINSGHGTDPFGQKN